MQRKNILALVILLLAGCFLFPLMVFRKTSFEGKTNHCIRLPVRFFPFVDEPLIKIEIEQKQYTMSIDTGSAHPLDLHKRVLDQIQNKKFINTARYIDMLGRGYPVSQFLIPEINFHRHLRLNEIDVSEENVDFLIKTTHGGNPKSLFRRIKEQIEFRLIDGRIGWPIFKTATSLFDFHHGELFLAENLAILQEEGLFHSEEFIKIPLELCKWGFVFSAQTELGERKFLLDTGTSHSIYREMNEQLRDPIVLTMDVSGQRLGRFEFIPFPLSPDHCEFDGILGIDFFKSHKICCDFEGKALYIRKAS